MKKTIIFDFDGTIADTIPNNNKIAEMFNLFAEKERFAKRLTNTDVQVLRDKSLREIIKQLQIPIWKIPFIFNNVQKAFKEDILSAKTFPGITKMIREIKKRNYVVGIVSSNHKEFIEIFLEKNNIQIFDFIYTDKGLFGKHRVINSAIRKHDIQKEGAFYVGDEIRDIDASKKADIKMISVTWGFNSKAGLQKHNPDFLIEDPKQLLSIVSLPVG